MGEIKYETEKQIKISLGMVIIMIAIVIIIVMGIMWYRVLSDKKESQKENEVYNSEEDVKSIPMPSPVYKPVIYLYPTEKTEILVKLNKPEQIICSYPEYKDEWKVIAEPNGELKYLETGRKLYSLYYESNNIVNFNVEEEGFVVKKDDIVKFLENKLEELGLNEFESEEFIIYWLPKLQENEYNYIRFATKDEINKNMPLSFSKNPDTLIRVLMTYKGLDKPIDVKEQKLESVERKGFVAVEWGGTEIK